MDLERGWGDSNPLENSTSYQIHIVNVGVAPTSISQTKLPFGYPSHPSWKLNPRVFKYPLLTFKTKKKNKKQIQKLKTKTPPEINKRKTQQKLKMNPKIKNKYSSNPTSKILAIICWGRKGLGKGLIFLSENYDFNKYFGNEN